MYSVYDYGWMIADKVRTEAYCRALREYVRDGTVVVDIGTGLGIWALIACKLGARKVYAIEASDAIHLARQIAAENGYGNRVQFIQDLSTHVTLSEKADLVVSDVHGVLPFFQQGLMSLIDARRRFLKPGGAMIPRMETIWAAIVDDAKAHHRFFETWDENSYGFNMRAARRIATNGFRKANLRPEQLLSEPRPLATLDYSRLETSNLRGQLECTITRTGTAHGLGVWFDSELAPGILMSNAPGSPPMIFGNVFFPLAEPVPVGESDVMSCDLRADLVSEDYVWTWETSVKRKSQPSEPMIFRQSTFFNEIYNSGQLQKLSARHVPTLNDEGLTKQFILEKMNGDLSLEAIANELAARFPQMFSTFQESLKQVTQLSKQYSR